MNESGHRVIRAAEYDVTCVHRGSGPLVILSYVLGPPAWGTLDELALLCTTVAVEPLRISPPERGYAWFGPLVRELGFESAALATWSLGAASALRFAVTEPVELSSLILVDPAGLSPTGRRFYLRPPPRSPENPTPDQIRAQVRSMWRSWVRGEKVDTAELEERHSQLLSNPDSYEYNRRANMTAAREMMFDDFRNVALPTLIVSGGHSRVLGPKAAKRLALQFPNARMEILPRSAHAPQLEEPGLFANLVAGFVKDTTRPRSG
jgi:pimeloyl-ACP methyl ester carboxylesterase